MKKNILINTILMSLLVVFSFSCKKDDAVGGTNVQNLSGDWYVKVNGAGNYATAYTYNTSDNSSTQMWIQSTGIKSGTKALGVKGKVSVNVTGQTFSGTGITNVNAATSTAIPTFAIANGKIVSNGTVGPQSKTPTDLISFDLIISGVTYKIEGYHKTGFLTDIP